MYQHPKRAIRVDGPLYVFRVQLVHQQLEVVGWSAWPISAGSGSCTPRADFQCRAIGVDGAVAIQIHVTGTASHVAGLGWSWTAQRSSYSQQRDFGAGLIFHDWQVLRPSVGCHASRAMKSSVSEIAVCRSRTVFLALSLFFLR